MPVTVRLDDIVEDLEIQSDDSYSFLDLDTGLVETVSRDLLSDAEESGDDDDDPDLPAWQKEEWETAKRIASTDRFRKLPTKLDVHEWTIMQDFALAVESEPIREDLLHAIHGAGAFRHFKSGLRRFGLQTAWFAFRTEALRQIAIDWCEEHQIAWE